MFRRQPVPTQVAQNLRAITIPAPTRGLILSENYTYMQPGGANVLDNWKPTTRGLQVRGGCIKWCTLPEATPIYSGFEYRSANNQKMFVGTEENLYDVSFAGAPTLVKSGQTSGYYSAAQLQNQGGNWMIVTNHTGDPILRYNGTTWTTASTTPPVPWANSAPYVVGNLRRDTVDNTYWKCAIAHTSPASGTFAAARTAAPTQWVPDTASDGIGYIYGPPGTSVANGENLSYVWKYRNRLYFLEGGTMNAWYLNTNAIGGQLQLIPLGGTATKGGKLIFGATWSIDAGDGIDDKCVFMTDQGEALIYTGSDPSDAANWRQEGRYQIPAPMGPNAHSTLGGDLLIATVDGIVPLSAAITKDAQQLELSMLTMNIKRLWRTEVAARNTWFWTMCRWDEYGAMFVTLPGGKVGDRMCLTASTATGAWARYVGWDATCFMRQRGDMFFGTQTGVVMQADRTGYDDGKSYTAIMVGGWEMFQAPSQTVVWHQARASFIAVATSAFRPQIAACVDYVIDLPPPISPGPDPGVEDVWDQALWDVAKWDQKSIRTLTTLNTGWVSVGATGFSHAPVLQVMIAQQVRPDVEMISIAATYEVAGVNV